MGANQNAVQSTVICVGAVVSTLMNSAFNALVCLAVHNAFLLFVDMDSMADIFFNIHGVFN